MNNGDSIAPTRVGEYLRKPLLVLDLVGVVEEGWPSRRSWLLDRTGNDPGAVPLMKSEILALIDEAAYNEMKQSVSNAENIESHLPVAGLQSVLPLLITVFRLKVVSTRFEDLYDSLVAWMRYHRLYQYFDDVVLLNKRGNNSQRQGKVSWAIDQNAFAIVEDDLRHFEGITENRVRLAALNRRGERILDARIIASDNWSDLSMKLIRELRQTASD